VRPPVDSVRPVAASADERPVAASSSSDPDRPSRMSVLTAAASPSDEYVPGKRPSIIKMSVEDKRQKVSKIRVPVWLANSKLEDMFYNFWNYHSNSHNEEKQFEYMMKILLFWIKDIELKNVDSINIKLRSVFNIKTLGTVSENANTLAVATAYIIKRLHDHFEK
jgi:hypothetical protein